MFRLIFPLLFVGGCASTVSYPSTQRPTETNDSRPAYFDCVVDYSYQVSKRAEANYEKDQSFLQQVEAALPQHRLAHERFIQFKNSMEEARGFDYRLDRILLDHRTNQWRAGSELLKEIRRSENRDRQTQEAFLLLLKVAPQLSEVQRSEDQPWPAFMCGVISR